MIDKDAFRRIQDQRIAVYSFVARLFEKPLEQADIDSLAQAGLEDAMCDDAAMSHGLQVIARYLRKRNTGTREVLNKDYTSAFYGVQDVGGSYAVPYESAFKQPNQLLMGEARRKVFNIYKKQSLRLREGVDIPEDHLAYMCEFMCLMAQKSLAAYSEGDTNAAKQNLLLQRAFLEKHILSWYDDFAKLAEQLVDERFYKGVLEFSGAFFVFDKRELQSLLASFGAVHNRFDLAWWEAPRSVEKGSEYRPGLSKSICIRKKGGLCDKCVEACPVHIDPVLDRDGSTRIECIRCGKCAEACPVSALTVD